MATLPPLAPIPMPSPQGGLVLTPAGKMRAVCPDAANGGEHITRALTGSGRDVEGRDFYVYNCSCTRYWKQVRVDQLRDGEVPQILSASNLSIVAGTGGRKRGQSGGGYLCSRCHQPKKNHVCLVDKRPKSAPVATEGGVAKKRVVVPDPVQIPVWFMELAQQERNELMTFVWGIERAGIEWTKEILFQMMKRHNINPTQAEDLIKLFCAGMPNDNHALCEMCGFPAIDEDAKLIACSVCDQKHCHALCGAGADWKCSACAGD